jgi:large subunit ribosomal protein L25
MAESVVLVAQKREGRGSRLAQQLRKQGRVPGIVYGHKQAVVQVALPADELHAVIRHGTRVLDLQTDGAIEKVWIREVQWDHLGKEILHIDFNRVAADERIRVSVPIEVKGTAPGVTDGGLLDQPIHVLHIECLAIAIPDSIRVNVGELQLDGAIHVRDLKLPEGVKVLDDPDAIVVHVTPPQVEAEAPVVEEGQAEPEVIGRPKGEEEGEGE